MKYFKPDTSWNLKRSFTTFLSITFQLQFNLRDNAKSRVIVSLKLDLKVSHFEFLIKHFLNESAVSWPLHCLSTGLITILLSDVISNSPKCIADKKFESVKCPFEECAFSTYIIFQ